MTGSAAINYPLPNEYPDIFRHADEGDYRASATAVDGGVMFNRLQIASSSRPIFRAVMVQ